MKKILCLMVLGALCVTGCASDEEKTMTCTRSIDQGSIQMELNYKVSYRNNNVTKVESIEKIVAEDSSILDTYKETVEKTYEPYSDIEYYDYHVSIDGNTLTSEANIDYEKVDTDKMIQVDSANGQFIKNGKIHIDDLQSIYESLGASCTK